MLRLKYWFLSYMYDLVTFVSAIVLLFVSDFIPYLRLVSWLPSLTKAMVIFVSTCIIIFLRSREKAFYFVPLTRREDKDDWMGYGRFEYRRTDKCFTITESESGYIFSKCLTWTDYKISLDFKIVSRCLGVILRAVSLSNYAMLQLERDGVKPHIRINGGWAIWKPEDVNLGFTSPLSLDHWYKLTVICDKDVISIVLIDHDGKPPFERKWVIPRGWTSFLLGEEKDSPIPTQIPFPINLDYGTIGFRNYGDEQALVKNVLIQKI
jgi:hypothetical protein